MSRIFFNVARKLSKFFRAYTTFNDRHIHTISNTEIFGHV
jgi:hypothetical protein